MKVTLTDYGISVTEKEPSLVAGSENVYECTVEVDSTSGTSWDGLTITSVWRNGSTGIMYVATPGTAFKVPHEVLADAGSLYVGCYGIKDESIVKTTIMVPVGVVQPGARDIDAESAAEPTPDVYQQLVTLAASATNASNITTGTLAIANGGTGATDAATALTNLGAASATDLESLRDSVSQLIKTTTITATTNDKGSISTRLSASTTAIVSAAIKNTDSGAWRVCSPYSYLDATNVVWYILITSNNTDAIVANEVVTVRITYIEIA